MGINVLINGFGTIGKRVALAVSKQKDMKLVGVANRSLNINVRNMMSNKGPLEKTNLYSSVDDKDKIKSMKKSNFNYQGNLSEALGSGKIDVVVDCTPKKVEKTFKPLYDKYNVKQIFQGGASASIAKYSFNAHANFEKSLNKRSTRVVSCNTTSLARTIHSINTEIGVKKVFASLIRRAVDPPDIKKGPINGLIPVLEVPSHHGPDVQTVIPGLNIKTMACKVPTTLAHVHMVSAELKQNITIDEIIDIFNKHSRIALFSGKEGYTSTAEIIEYFRDIERPAYNMYEVAVWKDSINTEKKQIYWSHAVHSEAIVVPENIDAIRALMGKERNKSIEMTDKSLIL